MSINEKTFKWETRQKAGKTKGRRKARLSHIFIPSSLFPQLSVIILLSPPFPNPSISSVIYFSAKECLACSSKGLNTLSTDTIPTIHFLST